MGKLDNPLMNMRDSKFQPKDYRKLLSLLGVEPCATLSSTIAQPLYDALNVEIYLVLRASIYG